MVLWGGDVLSLDLGAGLHRSVQFVKIHGATYLGFAHFFFVYRIYFNKKSKK